MGNIKTSSPDSTQQYSQTFDLSKVDLYTENLAHVGDRLGCTAAEDIYNEFGVLLIAKGIAISPKTVERLTGHRLKDPLDQVAQLAFRLSSRSLFSALNERIENVSLLSQISQAVELQSLIRHLCMKRELPSTPMQKLSVMAFGFPALYERTLIGCILAVAIGKVLEWDSMKLEQLFYAALFRDLGLLHLATVGDASVPQYSPTTLWHSLQSAAILREDNFFDNEVINLVRCHHERPDGTGYPLGTFGAQVSPSAWCLSFCDQIVGMKEREHLYLLLTPFLKVNSIGPGGEIANGLLKLCMMSEQDGSKVSIAGDRTEFCNKLMGRTLEINQIYALLIVLQVSLQNMLETDLERTIADIIQSNLSLIRTSGLDNTEIIEMLVGENTQFQKADRELLEFDLIQVEFLWRVKRFLLMTETWIKGKPKISSDIVELVRTISQIWQTCEKESLNLA